jgi:hypothetical protein
MTETEIWTKWESQVVNGLFPLRRFLGRSNHSVVFLTECRAQNLANAAIKIIPADPLAETQLTRWRKAAGLSHPHLLRIFETGRCKLGGHPFLFVITEYAEQNLAQILPHRGLTSDEAREILGPTLDVLAFLHGENLVHGQLSPPNLLVVNDQLKLSSDTIRPMGEPKAALTKPSPYDAPESRNGAISAAGDVWSLGATLMEALTQIPPGPHDDAEPPLPSSLPPVFGELVRHCLSNNPTSRPTIAELQAQLEPQAPVPAPDPDPVPVSAPGEIASANANANANASPPQVDPQTVAPAQIAAPTQIATPHAAATQPAELALPADVYRPATREVPRRPASSPIAAAPRWLVPAAAAGIVALVALWAGIRGFHSHASPQSPIVVQPTARPSSAAAAQAAATPAPAAAVLHEEVPAISHRTRESIHGQIKVVVRVTVDRSGNVVGESIEARGSSRYFAHLAEDSAKKWKFAPADNQSPREWLLQFEFSRSGVTGHADPQIKR